MRKRLLKRFLCYTLIIIGLGACASQKHSKIRKTIESVRAAEEKNQHFAGILIYDPVTDDTVYSKNSKKYFTPASNTKIFTLYTALKLLPDRIPALKYTFDNDTLYIRGTGDPTPFHPYFQDSTLQQFLKGYSNIALSTDNFLDTKFGPGWAWEDYDSAFSPERSALPLYGNVMTFYPNEARPQYFQKHSVSLSFEKHDDLPVSFRARRLRDKNYFFYSPGSKDTVSVPFIVNDTIVQNLLGKRLGRSVSIHKGTAKAFENVIYSVKTDSVLKRMMQQSDNFLAEQLLLLGSSMLSDTLSTKRAIKYSLDELLPDLKQPPRWVDGSGLSRYNLFSPESMVAVLYKMYRELPRDRLLHFFPEGGISGTLENWYSGNPRPYIYAKTGTLGNNHCLSGYLITQSGKILIFSYMNNHFRVPNSQIKNEMQRILESIRDSY